MRRGRGEYERDGTGYSAWRAEARLENLILIDFYARFLRFQHQGMTDALALSSVLAAFEIDGIPQEERPEMAERLLLWHSLIAATTRED